MRGMVWFPLLGLPKLGPATVEYSELHITKQLFS